MRIYGGYSLRRSLKDYGWAVALVVALAAFVLAYAGANPVRETVNVVRDVATGGPCPSGWQDASGGLDAPVRSCTRGKWVVVLKQDGSFSHGVELDRPGAVIVYDPALVPGWSQ